ncbi:44023_t:CDS:2, partial [Gigaspora margarita]
MKRVENVDVAEMVETMGVVSNMIDEGNDAAFDVPCNEIAAGSILVRSGSENGATEFGGDVVKNDGEDVNLNVQNNENNVNVGGRTENANIPGVRFEKHNDESDYTDWIDSNHRKEINECKSLVIESELTTSRGNEAYVNSDESKKAIPNRKSAGDMGDDPKDSINGDKAPDVKAYTPTPRYAHSAALIGNKLYILGGDNDSPTTQFTPTKDFFYLDISVGFNTSYIPWTDLSSVVGTPKQSRAAVSAGGPNKNIIFLFGGGVENPSSDIPLVYTFDTLKNVWDTPTIKGIKPPRREYIKSVTDDTDNGKSVLNAWTTVGTIPEVRAHHTSVLGLNNDRIIIYGGFSANKKIPIVHDLSVLDIRNKPYEWFIPNISGIIPPTPSRHTANIVGRYMIVTY